MQDLTQHITLIGILFIFLGIAFLMTGVLFSLLFKHPESVDKAEIRGGGIIFIGPIPLVFGTDRNSLLIILILVIALMILMLLVNTPHE